MSAVPRLEVDQVLDLVNHYARRARTAAGDEDKGFRPLGEVLGATAGNVPELDEATLHALADEAYEVFVKAHGGDDVGPVLNEMLARSAPTPRLADDGSVAWEAAGGDNVLRAALAVPLLNWLHTRGADRLGLCEGIDCADAFVDASSAGRRKYCSSTCLNRHKVAAYRRRAAEQGSKAGR
ncbi:CGNR zinc finger domain-containing protein [Georgenia sp. AZ-5]|uniref:CGNR zinc finger domain-containing protein n=1 Tax=Georgenia sp. AZ-5 TaxID=3367526 RepID=UPI00375494EF